MDIPEDDVGVELMNAKFRDMGILVATDDGYQVDPDYVDRIEAAVRKDVGEDVDADDPRFRQGVVRELESSGVPAGFEGIISNWVIHALRMRDWES